MGSPKRILSSPLGYGCNNKKGNENFTDFFPAENLKELEDLVKEKGILQTGLGQIQ
ncbi:MAG: hypothetical protein CM15mP127_12760 [Gammaproteobacteria bacterium]|nr:MAG: hypothetical protein CM15mP127_12760 [Gammaproteobacteria bacterium]